MESRSVEQKLPLKSRESLEKENRQLREDLEVFRMGFERVAGREVLLREILDHAPFGVMIRDRSGKIVNCNRKVCELFSSSRESVLGTDGDSFLAGSSRFPFSEGTDWNCGFSGDVELSLPCDGTLSVFAVVHCVEREGALLQIVYLFDKSVFREREEALQVSVFTDALTGIWNRAYLHRRLLEEMERVTRYGSSLSLVMFDIDRFKAFNDRFGHCCGDRILKRLADLVGSRIRASDCFSRWGGDEFVILSPVGRDEALPFANRLREEVRNGPWPRGMVLTISVGVVDFREEGLPPEVLLDRADQAMYCAKREGGDRVRLWSKDLCHSGVTGEERPRPGRFLEMV